MPDLAGATPWGAAIGAAGQVLSSAVATPPAGPSEAKSSGSIGGANFDNSGWNVTFGSNSGITSDRTQTTPANIAQTAAGLLDGNNMLYLLGGLVVWKLMRKKRG